MQSGKFKGEIVGGELHMQYEISEGQFVKLSAPLGAVLVPVLEQLKAKVESGEIDPIKGTDLDKTMIEGTIELTEKYLSN